MRTWRDARGKKSRSSYLGHLIAEDKKTVSRFARGSKKLFRIPGYPVGLVARKLARACIDCHQPDSAGYLASIAADISACMK